MQCRYAKSARGALARYVATRGLDSPDGLRDFTGCSNEWSFDAPASTSDVFVFKRSVSQKKESKSVSGVKAEVAEVVSALKKAVLPRAATATATASATTKPAAAVQKSDARPARQTLYIYADMCPCALCGHTRGRNELNITPDQCHRKHGK